ncbi:MAG: DUF4488 domain-containing protein [Bacteroidota bacterium]
MKPRLIYLFITLCSLTLLLSFSILKPKKSLFNGVWQFTEGTFNGGNTVRPRNVELKVFNNGVFDGYLMGLIGSRKTMTGTYKIVNDSVYTETLTSASNKPMVGKTYVIRYELTGDIMIASGSYDTVNDGNAVKVNYKQTWVRINYLNPQ